MTFLKLPSRNRLKNSDHYFLYNYDTLQLFNPNLRHYERFYYESRFLHLLTGIIKTLSKGKIIDLGCAQANFTISLAKKNYDMLGLDLRRFFIQYAKLKVEEGEEKNLDFVVGNVEKLPIKSESYDGVILGELLEHVSMPETIISEVHRILKPGRYLFISTPNGERLTPKRRRSYIHLKNIKRNWKGIEFAPVDHVFEFQKEELKNLILDSNFELISIKLIGLARILIPILCSFPLPITFIRRIERALVRIPLIQRKIAGTLMCICRKT